MNNWYKSSPVVSVGSDIEAMRHPPAATTFLTNFYQLVTEWFDSLSGDQEVTDQTDVHITNIPPSLVIKTDEIQKDAVVVVAAAAATGVTKRDPGIGSESRQPSKPPFRELGLGNLTFGILSPITAVLFTLFTWKYPALPVHVPVYGLCFGSVLLLYGFALTHAYPRFARTCEELGIIAVFTAFFELLAKMLSTELIWVPRTCIILVIISLVVLRLDSCLCIPAITASERDSLDDEDALTFHV